MSTTRVYVDGSWSASNPEVVGWGVVVAGSEPVVSFAGKVETEGADALHQVAGELAAAMRAVIWAKKQGFTDIVILHDYIGVAAWVQGTWKCKNTFTQQYRAFMLEHAKTGILIRFEKIAGNNPADVLARSITGAQDRH